MDSSHSVIGHPFKNISQVLPFKLKNKFRTQQSAPNNNIINLASFRKKISSRYKKMSVFMQQKFITYQLGGINSSNRQKINKGLLNNIKIQSVQLMLVNLVNETFLSKISEGIKSLNYDSNKYQLLVQKIQEIFKQILPAPKKRILIGQGQISQLYYVFFQNCFQQPFSLCCTSLVYLKIQLRQSSAKRSFSTRKRISQQPNLLLTVKTALYCSKCNTKLIQFYGQQEEAPESSLSPKKIHEILQIQRQRMKVKMSIMIGSGRFKRHRIDEDQCFEVKSSKILDESSFQKNRYQSLKLKQKDDIKYRLQSIIQSKAHRNDFFRQFSP